MMRGLLITFASFGYSVTVFYLGMFFFFFWGGGRKSPPNRKHTNIESRVQQTTPAPRNHLYNYSLLTPPHLDPGAQLTEVVCMWYGQTSRKMQLPARDFVAPTSLTCDTADCVTVNYRNLMG